MSFRTKEMLLSAILCILTSWKRPVTTTGFDHDDCVIQDETHFGCSHSPRGNGSMPFGRVQKTNQFSFIVVITFTRTFADRICGDARVTQPLHYLSFEKISFLIRKHGPDDAVWISDFEMNSSQGRVKVSWEPPSNSPFVEEKKEKKTPNQYTYAYGGCGAVMATLLGRAAFPLTWTRYWHMALFIFFASLVLPASTSGWFITFSVDIHTPFPEWGGASTSRVILISNNGVEGWAAFPGTRWTKERALDVSLLPNDYYKRDTSRYSFSRGCGRRNVEGRSPRFIAPKVPAEFLSLPFRALICLNTLALIQSASSTCAGFQQQYWFWEIAS